MGNISFTTYDLGGHEQGRMFFLLFVAQLDQLFVILKPNNVD